MAKEIYMSSNGVDTNNGLTVETPIKSFIKLDEIIEPNSIVNILGGSVFRDSVRYDSLEGMVVPDDENRVSNSDMAMLQYTEKYTGSLITLDKTNSLLNDRPVISAAVIVPQEAITEYQQIHTFTIRHRHGKHVNTNSVDNYSRACMWIDGEKLALVEDLEQVASTPNSYFVENVSEPSKDYLGVCKYYFNADFFGKQVECTFNKIIIWSEGKTSGNSIGVDIDSLLLCKGASKDGNHLIKGIATNIRFEDCANHNQLKSCTRLVGCESKGAGLYLFHQFSGSNVCSVSLESCKAYGDGTQTAFYTHDNGSNNSQKLDYKNIYIENVNTAFNWGGAKEVNVENVVVNGLKAYVICNYSTRCHTRIKNLLAYNRTYVNSQNSRMLYSESPVEMLNCALPGFLFFTPKADIVTFSLKKCTILVQSNTDQHAGTKNRISISESILASTREVTRQGSENTVPFEVFDTYTLDNLYFYNIVLVKDGKYGLPEDFGFKGNIKRITQELFTLKIFKNKRISSLKEKHVYSDNLIAYYTGNMVKYVCNIGKVLRYVNLGSGRSIVNTVYITDNEGNKYTLKNTYGERYNGGRLDSLKVTDKDGQPVESLSPNFVSGYILDWEKGIIQINTALSTREPDGEWAVSMDVVYDDCPEGIFVHDPNQTGDYSLIGGNEVSRMNIGYIPNKIG